MKIIGEKLSSQELLTVKGGCDVNCYCFSLLQIRSNPDNGQEAHDLVDAAWEKHCEDEIGPNPYT